MSGFDSYNDQQEPVVKTLDKEIAVRAGAGTGKTRTLVLRFANALSGGKDDGEEEALASSVDEVLAITFTNKAAAELVHRLRALLLRCGEVGQARKMDRAWVSTIDSFCTRLLRRYSLEADIDPGFTVLGEVRTAALEEEAFARALEDTMREDADVAGLLESYAPEDLSEEMVTALEQLRAMGRRPEELKVAPRPDIGKMAEEVAALGAQYRAEVERMGGPSNKTQEENLKKTARIEEALSAASSGEAHLLENAIEVLSDSKLSRRAEPKEAAEAINGLCQEAIRALTTVKTRAYARGFCVLLERFSATLQDLKRQQGVLDFKDLVEEVRELFEDHPQIAKDIADGFKLLMVDEFQDTDRAQVDALEHLRRGNLCVVGDEKQAIYGFRYADVGLFEEMLQRLEVYDLTINYRSHEDVLDAVNDIFSTEQFFGDSFRALTAGREEPDPPLWPEGLPRVQVVISDSRARSGVSTREAQAEIVAEEVQRMLAHGVEPGDIVLLMRSLSEASVYVEALRTHGIETAMASGAFYETVEVGDVRALLRAMLLPQDDAAMLRVLSGPLVSLSADSLFALGRREWGKSLWEKARDLLAEEGAEGDLDKEDLARLGQALAALERLRGLHDSVPVSRLVLDACEAFDYDLTLLSAGPDGTRAWGNVLKLSRMAAEIERTEPLDAGSFLEYLERHEKHAEKESGVPLATRPDAVRVMSIHAAKGLEFPVVVVADLGRPLYNEKNTIFLVGRRLGEARLGIKSPKDGSKTEGLADEWYVDLREQKKEEAIAEEKRIFYVACTRAREALLLVGDACVDRPSESSLAGLLLNALGASARDGHAAFSEEDRACLRIERFDERESPSERSVQKDFRGKEPEDGRAALTWEEGMFAEEGLFPEERAAIPPSVSYSSLRLLDLCPRRFLAEEVLGLGRFYGERSEDDARKVGSALHAVLEALPDLRIDERTVEVTAKSFGLSDEGRSRVEQAVACFCDSPLAQRAREADRHAREVEFSIPLSRTRLEGKIDLLCQEGDSVLLVDYKTGVDPSLSDSAAREAGHRLQADCYALAALEAGTDSAEVCFVFVEQDGRTKSFNYRASEKEEMRARLDARLDAWAESVDGQLLPMSEEEEGCAGCPAKSAGLCRPHSSASAVE